MRLRLVPLPVSPKCVVAREQLGRLSTMSHFLQCLVAMRWRNFATEQSVTLLFFRQCLGPVKSEQSKWTVYIMMLFSCFNRWRCYCLYMSTSCTSAVIACCRPNTTWYWPCNNALFVCPCLASSPSLSQCLPAAVYRPRSTHQAPSYDVLGRHHLVSCLIRF